jgi:exosortase
MKKTDNSKVIILFLLTILAYLPTFIWMFKRSIDTQTYYSHGFLVPFISLFIVWYRRKKLNKLKINSSQLGWLFFISGISIHILSSLCQVYFTSGFSLILVIVGLILLFLGKDYLKELLFPTLFLIFMIPLPLLSISNLSFQLKILASRIAVSIVNYLGIPVMREGSTLRTLHSYLVVEDPCSGMSLLIALIALGSLTAYFSKISKIKKVILFLSSIPVAVASNAIRIIILTLVSELYGTRLATGMFHNIMGILVFVFAIIGLLLIQNVLE